MPVSLRLERRDASCGGAAIGWIWLRDRLPAMRVLGLVIGFAGIVVLVWDKFDFSDGGTGLAVVAALLAPLCYGIAANSTKRYLSGVDALSGATGSMVSASLLLMPFAIWTWPPARRCPCPPGARRSYWPCYVRRSPM